MHSALMRQIKKNAIICSNRVHLESFATTAAEVALTVAVDSTFRKTFKASVYSSACFQSPF